MERSENFHFVLSDTNMAVLCELDKMDALCELQILVHLLQNKGFQSRILHILSYRCQFFVLFL